MLASLAGPLTLEGVLGQLISAIRRELLVRGHDAGDAVRALDVAARADLGWADRWAILRQHVLGRVPVLMVLDNFEDNLRPDGDAGYAVGDEVLAGLLAAWVADPGAARLLVTSRYPFTLPGGAEQALSFRQLGALSRAETMKLAWSLPALDRLDESQLDRVWRLAGGHPRSLEYLDALLSGGTARYPDVTRRLDQAVSRRLGGGDKERWLAARSGLDAALAETVALAADDVLLEDLLARLGQVPGAVGLLLGVSVYREPVDANAVVFQAGQPDPAAENLPDRGTAYQQISEILAAAGITADDSFDPARVPAQVRAQLAPHIAELNRAPAPPFLPPLDLAERVAACQAASLLTISGTGPQRRFFVHRWTATELAARAAPAGGPGLGQAHRQAAAYWQWRNRVWPQDRAADVHDLLEARHHLLAAGDIEAAGQVTEWICSQLDTWGAWDQETSLIHDTLTRLPPNSPRHAAWIHQLGILAQNRGDYREAERQYQRALNIKERLGDQAGMANSYNQLGMLAQARGDYGEADRQYQRALDIDERLGDQARHGQLLPPARHPRPEPRRLRRSRTPIPARPRASESGSATRPARPTPTASSASSPRTAGTTTRPPANTSAPSTSSSGSATRPRWPPPTTISASSPSCAGTTTRPPANTSAPSTSSSGSATRPGMATSYHQLGILAQLRGDYDEATRQYQRALDIFERLGDQAGMATTYSQLGILEANGAARPPRLSPGM